MELKVWVEGIPRVVCGVTDDTTCQDVVIALAHAMGRTGRFTLIEKWRDVERPLSAAEFPLRVLHKWGEYANDVKLFLCQSDTDKYRRNDKWKKLDQFTHNFSPPVSQANSVIKRSLTFTGAHNSIQTGSSPSSSLSLSSHPTDLHRNYFEPYHNSLSPRSSNHSYSSTSSSIHLHPPHQQQQQHRSPPPSSSTSSSTTEHGHATHKNMSMFGGQIPSQHCHVPPHPTKYLHEGSGQNYRLPPASAVSQDGGVPRLHPPRVNMAPVELSLDSPRHSRQTSLENIEEYNLDHNFPDNSRDCKRHERVVAGTGDAGEHTEYRLDEHDANRPESEKCRLLRLVSLQKERLKVQESELDVIETEIVSLEEKDREFDKDIEKVCSDISLMEEKQTVIDSELEQLESVEWIEVLQQEQTKGKELQLEISTVKNSMCKCERKIDDTAQRQKELEELIEKEKQLVHTLEEENKQKEKELKSEISRLQNELSSKQTEFENDRKSLSEVLSEHSEIETRLKEKHYEADILEEKKQQLNMKEFVTHPPDLSQKSESGQVVLKLLEGRMSPRPMTSAAPKTSTTQLTLNNVLSTKNPNGVWV
ncbi:nuclear transcription factor Y subunit gamma-like [Gigantopelta aegis]|uniref:nuclear transcription factor Y subunit gamma-like n=1 Tax=Gigantopelta aegis TaxID=1735272 RepID=UPI001B88AEF7|nr:nuclear transcription factor Y subunit gamma-like [Gigantopelta aegis]